MSGPDTSTEAFIAQLTEISREISEGNYAQVDTLLDMTREGNCPPFVAKLAEAFGLMTVKIEAREFQLERTIATLETKNEELLESIRQLAQQKKIQGLLTRFIPESVRRRVEANPDNPDLEKREADITVLFLDIAGYTAMSETLDSDTINQLIERYFSSFMDDIYKNGGDINETAGDGLMVIFQDPEPDKHALQAVHAAMAIQEKVAAANLVPMDHPPVNINIGINSGPALLGSTRLEGANGSRWTFTASGMTTNIAARLSRLASGGNILVSEETAKRVGEHYHLEASGNHRLKNVSVPVPAWQVGAFKIA